jgi:hypothetical protein
MHGFNNSRISSFSSNMELTDITWFNARKTIKGKQTKTQYNILNTQKITEVPEQTTTLKSGKASSFGVEVKIFETMQKSSFEYLLHEKLKFLNLLNSMQHIILCKFILFKKTLVKETN